VHAPDPVRPALGILSLFISPLSGWIKNPSLSFWFDFRLARNRAVHAERIRRQIGLDNNPACSSFQNNQKNRSLKTSFSIGCDLNAFMGRSTGSIQTVLRKKAGNTWLPWVCTENNPYPLPCQEASVFPADIKKDSRSCLFECLNA
ncbi:hypothetical protein, partial [uncultured Allobaculum sp.]|uniref:hypothetical protein n=1 Tax=uncultured Allobaculum sp. TaxID=1187017 RepID=UPI0026ED0FCE